MKRSTKVLYACAFGGWLWAAAGAAAWAADPPAPLEPTNVWPTLYTLQWVPTGPFDSTLYHLQVSPDPGYSSLALNLVTQFSSWTLTGLSPGTTYYSRVLANYGTGTQTAFAALPTTTTLASSPPGPAAIDPIISSFTHSSITVTWQRPIPPPGAFPVPGFRVEASTASDFSGTLVSATSFGPSTAVLSGLGLVSATTYYVRVGALYPTGNEVTTTVNYVPTTPSFVRLDDSNAITGLTAYQIGSTSITWVWNPVSGAAAYNVYQATSPSTLLASVAASSFTDTGLAVNTLYGRVVSAVVEGVEGPLCDATSGYTLAATPGGPAYSSVHSSSATLEWDGNGNPGGTIYELNRSVASNFISWTTYPTTQTTHTFTNLAIGTTYYFRIRVKNTANVYSTGPITSTRTLGNFVAQNVTAAVNSATSITWTWDPVQVVDLYQVHWATSPAQWETALGPSFTRSNLLPNTAYGKFIRSRYFDATGDPSETVAAYTLAVVPGQPSFSQVSYTSATVTWAAQGNPSGTVYEVSRSTVSDFSAGVSTPVPASANFTGTTTSFFTLTPGTTYYFRVRAENGAHVFTAPSAADSLSTLSGIPSGLAGQALGTSSITWTWDSVALADSYNLYQASSPATLIAGALPAPTYTHTQLSTNTLYGAVVTAVFGAAESAQSAAASRATLASAPTAANPTNVSVTQLTAHWNANGNPAGTPYLLQTSTDSGFSVTNVSSTTISTSAAIAGLSASTTYYMRVRAINVESVATAFTALPSTETLIAPPAAPTLSAAAAGVSSITWSWNPVAGAAGYRLLSALGDPVSGDLASSVTFYTQVGLSTNTAYSARAAAFNLSGASSSSLLMRYTLADPPSGSVVAYVGSAAIALHWSDGQNPAGTSYQARLWKTGGATTTIAGSSLSATFADLSSATTYFLSVIALNGDGIGTAADITLSTATLTSESAAVEPESGQTIILNGHNGPITLEIPAQAFAESVVITLQEPAGFPTDGANAAQFLGTNVGVEITLDQPVEPSKVVTLSIPFADSEITGLDKDKLILARYDEPNRVWVPFVSRVDPLRNTVTAGVNHFSIYRIMQAVVPDALGGVAVFPNPFRPAQGHTSVTIANLPAGARLRIYTAAAERVKDLSTDAAGMASWDGTNESGQKVASGLYFVLIEGGGDKKRLRVVVQR